MERKKIGKIWYHKLGKRWIRLREAGCVWNNTGCIETDDRGIRKVRRHCRDCGRFVWRWEHLDRFWKKGDWDIEPVRCERCYKRKYGRAKKPAPVFELHCRKCGWKVIVRLTKKTIYKNCPRCDSNRITKIRLPYKQPDA